MEKIKKTFTAFKEILKNPYLLNLILDENEVWKKKVVSNYNLPDGLPVIQLNTLFPDFSETLESFSFLGGGSLPTDIALLKSLCRRYENAKYFEIGTWRGESVRNVSSVANECFTLNLSKKQMLELGFSEKYADAHAIFSKGLPNVQHIEGDSRTFDYAGLDKKFDVIFIDGNHHFDFVKSDTEKVFENLMHENSVVVWHDYAYNPDKIRFEILHAILDGVPKNLHQHLYFVANTMSAVFIKGNFPTSKLELYKNPEFTYEVTLKIKNV